MRQSISEVLIVFLLVIACMGACALFWLLPLKAMDTNLVYQGF